MVRTKLWTTVGALALLVLGSSAYADEPKRPQRASGPQGEEVEIVGFRFLPPVSVVEPGASITWVNGEPTEIPHDVAAVAYAPPGGTFTQVDLRICPVMLPGETCTRNGESDPEPLAGGTYLYVCMVNAAHTALMQGVLTVE